MRRSAWLLIGPGAVAWMLALAIPALALLVAAPRPVGPMDGVTGLRHGWSLLASSNTWVVLIAVPAVLVGWLPGRTLRSLLGTGAQKRSSATTVMLPAFLLAPAFLPAHLSFFAWWQALGPDGAAGAWLIRHDLVATARQLTLWFAMVCWSWPVVAWCIAAGSGASRAVNEAMTLDGARALSRLRSAWHEDRPGLALAAVVIMLFALGNTSAFDLAQVRSLGFELRTLDTEGASPGALLRSAAPGVGVALILSLTAWMALNRACRAMDSQAPRPRAGAVVATCGLLIVTVGAPLTLLLLRLGADTRWGEFFRLYGAATVNTLVIGLAVAVVAATIAVAVTALAMSARRFPRRVAAVVTLSLLLVAAIPATLVAAAIATAYNRPMPGPMLYDTPVAVVLAHVACFGFVAAALGWLVAAGEAPDLRDARRLDGATSAGGAWRAAWPRFAAAAGASGAVVFALSLSEIIVAARLQPPGWDGLAASMLNALHYQHTETVLHAVVIMLGLALLCALVAVLAWTPIRRVGGSAFMLTMLLGLVLLPGCRRVDPGELRGLPVVHVFGGPGRFPGQFDYPRAIAADERRECLYVVDKTARVQRLALDGTPEIEWQMPEWTNGKPTGISVAPDGTVYVADTHYFRIIAFDAEGNERFRFGSYGREPGQFIYPTDVAFGPDGLLYVAEYGGNDRIQVFGPDGAFQFAFGSQGDGPDQFNRPQSIAFSHDRSELYVADACNHRIVVTDPRGNVLRTFGRVGSEPGELTFPYGLVVLKDGSLLVTEFGNARVQRLDATTGACLGLWGGMGFKPGELRFPWSTEVVGRRSYVLDSGNQRIQEFRLTG